jgi:hypothetical protein
VVMKKPPIGGAAALARGFGPRKMNVRPCPNQGQFAESSAMPRDGAMILSDVRQPALELNRRAQAPAKPAG